MRTLVSATSDTAERYGAVLPSILKVQGQLTDTNGCAIQICTVTARGYETVEVEVITLVNNFEQWIRMRSGSSDFIEHSRRIQVLPGDPPRAASPNDQPTRKYVEALILRAVKHHCKAYKANTKTKKQVLQDVFFPRQAKEVKRDLGKVKEKRYWHGELIVKSRRAPGEKELEQLPPKLNPEFASFVNTWGRGATGW